MKHGDAVLTLLAMLIGPLDKAAVGGEQVHPEHVVLVAEVHVVFMLDLLDGYAKLFSTIQSYCRVSECHCSSQHIPFYTGAADGEHGELEEGEEEEKLGGIIEEGSRKEYVGEAEGEVVVKEEVRKEKRNVVSLKTT